MSDPRGQTSDFTTEHSRLNQASTSGEFAESFSDTSSYFEAWLAELEPKPKSQEDFAPTEIMFDNTPAAGEFRFEGTLRLDGYVKGLVHSLTGTLILSEAAELESDIVVAIAIIDGCLRGDIHATERVELLSHAKVFGNITSPALAIQSGAIFEGERHFIPPSKSAGGDTDTQERQRASRGDAPVTELQQFAAEISGDEVEAVAETFAAAATR